MDTMPEPQSQQYELTLSSSTLQEGALMPQKHAYHGLGCQGTNVSPHLEWRGAPPNTKSFAVTCYDPDAPVDGWWHWTVINIPDNVNLLEEGTSGKGTLPRGAQELWNDYEEKGYGGPCPPQGHGPHRYIFTVYALGVDKLYADAMETGQTLLRELENEALEKATLTVIYERK